ncbi:uncharacterized protein LOC127136394 [Lathyrus oleraceus]|uniref:uncharacterized protein LOC127136394 n=1 Tax=Pisum sativum TaxID=3888 RepID=UPI0021CEBF82|nr:uncharacterized protein LOC127136394 [Pisum sativum]
MPFLFYPSSFSFVPEPEFILQEDMDKLTDKIQELELENTQLRVQLNRAKERNHTFEDNGKKVYEEFAVSKKRLKEVKYQRVWVGGALLGANSELDTRNDKLDQAYRSIRDLEKTFERSNSMKKEAREDYKAKVLELRATLKECKDLLAKEHLEREKVHRSFLREQFNLGRAYEKIKNLKMGIYDQAYLDLQNECIYWGERCHGAEASIAQRDEIIHNLQTLNNEWRDKYGNMTVLTNYALQDFPDKLKEDDLIMCPKKHP